MESIEACSPDVCVLKGTTFRSPLRGADQTLAGALSRLFSDDAEASASAEAGKLPPLKRLIGGSPRIYMGELGYQAERFE
jgi:hypothetical protein